MRISTNLTAARFLPSRKASKGAYCQRPLLLDVCFLCVWGGDLGQQGHVWLSAVGC